MSLLNYPEVTEYVQPSKNILVISCIDLRLTDNLLHFLHFDNLHNRYDHVSFAGTSLCSCALNEYKKHFTEAALKTWDFKAWKKAMDEHLQIAIALHQVKDVYIVEHMDCGAYQNFLDLEKPVTPETELKFHTKFAKSLSKEIHSRVYEEKKDDGTVEKYRLNVHCFIIDLRGNVDLLHTTTRSK